MERHTNKITMIGCGYVGLVSGAGLAEVGHQVRCVDIDPARIALLRGGGVPIHEPGLAEIIRRNVGAGRLDFTDDIRAGVEFGDLVFIAVGTPPDEDGSADLKHVLKVAMDIGRHMDRAKTIVIKSTVPVGTADRVAQVVRSQLAERGCKLEFAVVSNPEFLKEGVAIADFMEPDRIVVGSDDPQAIESLRQVYEPFLRGAPARFLDMGLHAAELTKYAANAMLATRISFMNELANLAETLGADIEEIRLGIGADARIGHKYLAAGIGYGGSCLPKDVRAMLAVGRQHGHPLPLLSAVDATNSVQYLRLLDKLEATLGADLSGRRLAVWGLAFKPDTDDMREAPSRPIITALIERGAQVVAHDPVAIDEARRVLPASPRLTFSQDMMAALDGADALLVLTEWPDYRVLDWAAVKAALRQPKVFDGRNLYDPWRMAQEGFEYHAIGRWLNPMSSKPS